MLFYVQMKWNYQGRLTQDLLWAMEEKEGKHGIEGIRSGKVKLYKVVSHHRVIAIVDVDSLEDLDRNTMGWLPMREYLEFEQVWALRDYEGFIEDVKQRFPPPGAAAAPSASGSSSGQGPLSSSASPAEVTARWFGALASGDGASAIACLADNVHWDNNTGIPGLSDVIPWLGIYDGREAVAGSFKVWMALAQVQSFQLLKTFTDGNEVVAIVHEVGLVKKTQKTYDIEFVQRFTVENGRITRWKSYWDTAKAIAAFRP